MFWYENIARGYKTSEPQRWTKACEAGKHPTEHHHPSGGVGDGGDGDDVDGDGGDDDDINDV